MSSLRTFVIGLAALLVVAGCSPAAPTTPAARPAPTTATSAAPPTPSAVPSAGAPSATPNAALAIERTGRNTIRATVTGPGARSWRLVVAGIGAHRGDRWIIEVDTGDIGPVVAASETINGHEGEAVEISELETGAARGRVCATRLPVCLDAATFRLPQGDGALAATLVATDAAAKLTISGGHATWDGEPFVLGPWTTTDPVPWQG
jgi:hypothetical protein